MNRRKEREYILKILYAVEYNPISWKEEVSLYEESNGVKATPFAKELIAIYVEKLDS